MPALRNNGKFNVKSAHPETPAKGAGKGGRYKRDWTTLGRASLGRILFRLGGGRSVCRRFPLLLLPAFSGLGVLFRGFRRGVRRGPGGSFWIRSRLLAGGLVRSWLA